MKTYQTKQNNINFSKMIPKLFISVDENVHLKSNIILFKLIQGLTIAF